MNQFANYLQYYTQREPLRVSPISSPFRKELTFSPQFSPNRSKQFEDIEPPIQRGMHTKKVKQRIGQYDKENDQNCSNISANCRERKNNKRTSPGRQSNLDNSCLVPIDKMLCLSINSNLDENLVEIDSVKKVDLKQSNTIGVQAFDEQFKKVKITPKLDDDFESISSFRSHIQTPRQQHLKKISFVLYKKQNERRV